MRYLIAILLALSAAMPVLADEIESVDTATGVVIGGSGGLIFVTGGIGADQQAAMGKIASACNLHLTFSRKKGGEYLAGVKVKIRDKGGKDVFDVENAGPLFFTKLPPGTYIVVVDWHGTQQKKDVQIAKSGARNLYFHWADLPDHV